LKDEDENNNNSSTSSNKKSSSSTTIQKMRRDVKLIFQNKDFLILMITFGIGLGKRNDKMRWWMR